MAPLRTVRISNHETRDGLAVAEGIGLETQKWGSGHRARGKNYDG